MTGAERLRLADGFGGRADDVYAALIQAHEGLTDQESQAFNARLILILANQIGAPETIFEAIRCAAETAPLSHRPAADALSG